MTTPIDSGRSPLKGANKVSDEIDRESVDPLHVKSPDGITRRVDEHYFVPSDVQQDPHGAWLAIQNLCAALNEAEAERHRWRQAASIGSIHTQADLDRAAQEARALALEEALVKVSGCDRVSEVGPAIRALIDTPAAEALERVRAEAYLSGWVNGSNGVEPPEFGNPVFEKAPGD